MAHLIAAAILIISALDLTGVIDSPWYVDMVLFFVMVAIIVKTIRGKQGDQ